jgi:hypothetical protein
MATTVIVLLLSALVEAQSELPREVLDLSRIKAKMNENLDRLPDYTSLETINRSHRASAASVFRHLDTVRVEVARIGEREFYSWPGARRFEGNVADLVHSGTTSSGEFASHAHSLFANAATQIRYVGPELFKGRRALKYDYRLASFASGWTLTFVEHSGTVAAYGSFRADAETLDLLQLEARADEIPADLPYTAASSEIDYGKVRIGEVDVLLPQRARLSLSKRDGEDRNEVGFSQCRAYSTQSAIHFDAEPVAESVQPSIVPEFALAPNIPISLQLMEAIDSNSAAEGDMITARVVGDAKLKGQIIVPRGALVKGRIRRLESYAESPAHFIVGLEFMEIDFGSSRGIFNGRLEQIDPLPGLSWVLSTKKGRAWPESSWQDASSRAAGGIQILQGETLSTAELPGVGTFFMQGTHFRLPEGLRMNWRTQDLTH